MRRSKYKNVWTEYRGNRYASKREARYAAELDLLVKAGELQSWRRQVRIPLHVNGRRITTYVCDFETKDKAGNIEYVEIKGQWLPEALLKWKLFDAVWPHLKKRVVR